MSEDPSVGTASAGAAASHPDNGARSLFVAPTDRDDLNVIRQRLAPVACWSTGDDRFEFDTSFPKTGISDELTALHRLRSGRHLPMTIFGHTDATGDDDYNKVLSGRRSAAIYALLTRRKDLWEKLYSNQYGGDRWGLRSLQEMLGAIRNPDSRTGAPFYAGPVNGFSNAGFSMAVKTFQFTAGLSVDGDPGPETREALFSAYMDGLCRDPEGTPFQLDPALDFLAAGQDAQGKGDYQGCSELNPILVMSRTEIALLSTPGEKSRRDRENTPNRRVIALLFAEGTRLHPEAWPCPRTAESLDGCRRRLWTDSDARRAPGDERRTFAATRDTFGCRFYQRLAHDSPCEGVVFTSSRTPFHISLSLRSNSGRLVLRKQPYRLYLGGGTLREGETDEEGHLSVEDVPAGDYLLQVGEAQTFVPATTKSTAPRVTRVPGFFPVE